ncbi:MAG: VWA domain-containing protein [Anaerolineae bacterium]|nr:VWA domain-containing protein [Anaerolineae bacterium]
MLMVVEKERRVGTAVEVTLAESSRLAAGEVDDNLNWADYLAYLQAYPADDVIRLDVTEPQIFQVVDVQGQPLPGVLIQVTVDGQPLTELRTHGDGSALFFPGIYGAPAGQYEATAVSDNQTVSIPFTVGDGSDGWGLTFPEDKELATAVPLDILFLVDATGSMDDEIRQLKDNMVAIAMQISALPSQPDVRFSLVTYRDRTDDFLVNTVPFTSELESFVAALAEIEAGGGGDYPEDLQAGLASALYVSDWRQENGVSLIFLIADAPPHLDYEHEDDYAVYLQQAVGHGIKIYPIASSGLDAQGEYIFRQLAQVTNGRFIFLTDNGDEDGVSSGEANFAITDYTVADLDELIIQIVAEELAPLVP